MIGTFDWSLIVISLVVFDTSGIKQGESIVTCVTCRNLLNFEQSDIWYGLVRNACFCNHKGTKIRVWASEIKTAPIQAIVSSFVRVTDSRQGGITSEW